MVKQDKTVESHLKSSNLLLTDTWWEVGPNSRTWYISPIIGCLLFYANFL